MLRRPTKKSERKADPAIPHTYAGLYSGSISALSRHRRRHVHCAGMGMPVLKMSALERRSF